MGIHGVKPAGPATTVTSTQETAPAATTSASHKTLYGDPSRAEGLMNTMNIMKQLSVSAERVVSSRNHSLQ
jgi:hypothetical protein